MQDVEPALRRDTQKEADHEETAKAAEASMKVSWMNMLKERPTHSTNAAKTYQLLLPVPAQDAEPALHRDTKKEADHEETAKAAEASMEAVACPTVAQ